MVRIRNTRGWGFGVVALFLFTFVSAYSARAADSPAGKLVDFRGHVEILSLEKQLWESASVGRVLMAGECISTGADGWAAVLMADESLVQLNRNSKLELKQVQATAGWLASEKIIPASAGAGGTGSVYQMDSGEVWLRNKNRDVKIDIRTPTVSAAIRGTELNMAVGQDSTTILTVLEGQVGAGNELGQIVAGPREQVIARRGMKLEKRILLTPEDTVQWTLSVPELFSHHDIHLVPGDRAQLRAERDRLKSEVSAGREVRKTNLRLAQVERDLGLTREAADRFRHLLIYDPEDDEALTGLGWTHLDSGSPSDALDCFRKVRRPSEMTSLGLAAAAGRMGESRNALSSLQEARSLFPDFSPLILQEALILLEARQLQAARNLMAEATRQHPDDPMAWSLLALIELVAGDKDSALNGASTAVRLAPDSPTVYLVAAYVYQARFELDRAMQMIQKALRYDPENALGLTYRATLLFASDHTEEAMKTARQAIKLAPDSAPAHTILGFILLAQRKTAQALSAFRKASELDPSAGEPHLGLSILFMREGKEPEAMEELSTAVLLEPRRSLFLSYWGKMLHQLKRFDKALDMLKLAADLDPRDPTPHYYSSIILRDVYRPTEAVESLQRAIALNDNRAVYRSRFLLDRDQASRNVNLAQVFNELGMADWAKNKAVASVKQDYANYSAHAFLAGAYAGLPHRVNAQASELILSQILQPANQNAFNTFNDYTSLFESPDVKGTLSGTIGTQATLNGTITVFGAAPQWNVAYQGKLNSNNTDGWRGTNYEESVFGWGKIKWDATPRDSFLFSIDGQTDKSGDELFGRYEWSRPADPVEYHKGEITNFEVGYHHHFGPKSDTLLYFQHKDSTVEDLIHSTSVPYPAFPRVTKETFETQRNDGPYTKLQAVHLQSFGNHQLILGGLESWGDNDGRFHSRSFLKYHGQTTPYLFNDFGFDMDQSYRSYSIQDIWHIAQNVTLEAAGYYEHAKVSDAFQGTDWTVEELSPRVGLIYEIRPQDTLRVAAFRYVVPFFFDGRLDPSETAGIPLYRTSLSGSVAEELDVAWEHEWSTGFLSAGWFYQDRSYDCVGLSDGIEFPTKNDSIIRGVEAGLNQMVWRGMGLSAGYRYSTISDEWLSATGLSNANYKDHTSWAGLKYIHPSGFWGSLLETYRHTDSDHAVKKDQNIWITDMAVGYRFPGRKGSVTLEVRNAFDEHFDWLMEWVNIYGRAPCREVLFSVSYNF